MQSSCRILLTSESVLLLEGLVRLLEEHTDAEVRGTARRDDAVPLAESWRPDVILVETGDTHAIDGHVQGLRLAVPGVPFVVVAPADRDQFLAAILLGVRGFVGRHASAQELANCIKAVARGDWGLPRSMVGDLVDEYVLVSASARPVSAAEWTDRELAVLRLLGQGLGAQQIGQNLYLSESTIRSIIQGLMRKLGVGNRVQVLTEALRRGIIVLE